jgi:creatinine amidohydrolase
MHPIEFQGKSWLQNMTWKEVDTYLRDHDSILLPIGQTEEHGEHLPTGTDTYAAIGIAQAVAEAAGIIIAPPLWYGWAPRMLSYPGSVTLSASTLTAIVTDICNSLVTHGFKRIYIINGHRRENLPPVQIAATNVRYNTGALVAILDPLYLGVEKVLEMRAGNSNILSHAAGIETAHMLHVVPGLVRADKIADTPEEKCINCDDYDQVDRPMLYDTPAEFREIRGETGVRGYVSWGTAERGAAYQQAVVESIAAYIATTGQKPVDLEKPAPIV